jgi:glycosyltransferase involved in cell wall biosynthesis
MTRLRITVMTVVHHPLDTRILVRQISALIDAGHDVTYAAPFSAFDVDIPPGVRGIDLPRSAGRRRLAAMRAARRVFRELTDRNDIFILHDPELVVAMTGVHHTAVVWDVHEDTAAAVGYKDWIPAGLDRAVASGVRLMERWAESRHDLLLAETGYTSRFRRPHPVVPNSTLIDHGAPPPGRGRAVCVSTLTRARGALDLIEVGRLLRPHGIVLDVIGPAAPEVREQLSSADLTGDIRWHGRLAHADTLDRVRGATCGLSLLHDERNYRHSHPTKVFEYLAHGVPVVATRLPLVAELLDAHQAGITVPFCDPAAAAAAVLALHEDDDLRTAMGRNGIAAVRAEHNWEHDSPTFVAAIEAVARAGSHGSPSSHRR